jgi:hypothetical protein
MEDRLRLLLTDLAEFIRPIANGKTESQHNICLEAKQLIQRIADVVDSEK